MADENKVFPKKYMNKIKDLPDFIGGVESMNTDEIKQKILECEGHLYEIDQAKDGDKELTLAKEKVKEFGAPYKESKGIEVAKLQYCLFILESRGVNL